MNLKLSEITSMNQKYIAPENFRKSRSFSSSFPVHFLHSMLKEAEPPVESYGSFCNTGNFRCINCLLYL